MGNAWALAGREEGQGTYLSQNKMVEDYVRNLNAHLPLGKFFSILKSEQTKLESHEINRSSRDGKSW